MDPEDGGARPEPGRNVAGPHAVVPWAVRHCPGGPMNTAPDAQLDRWHRFRASRNKALASDYGWLTLTSFQWLEGQPAAVDLAPGTLVNGRHDGVPHRRGGGRADARGHRRSRGRHHLGRARGRGVADVGPVRRRRRQAGGGGTGHAGGQVRHPHPGFAVTGVHGVRRRAHLRVPAGPGGRGQVPSLSRARGRPDRHREPAGGRRAPVGGRAGVPAARQGPRVPPAGRGGEARRPDCHVPRRDQRRIHRRVAEGVHGPAPRRTAQ